MKFFNPQEQHMEIRIAIYILVDPRQPGRVRYVGQTKTPQTRHLPERATTSKSEWLEQLRADGVMPQMVIVTTVTESEANNAEKLWIERFKFAELTNSHHVEKQCGAQQPAASASASLEEAGRDLILRTLAQTGGNKKEAAKRLGIGRQTLYNKLKCAGIQTNGKAL